MIVKTILSVKSSHLKRRVYVLKRLGIIFISFYTVCHAWGGLEDVPIGARSLAMGAAYVALANNAESVFLNPGGLDQLTGAQIALFYQKPFGLEDLNFGTLAVSLPVRHHRLSVGFVTLGHRFFKEHAFTLSYSRNLRQRFYYGIGVRYHILQINGYGSSGAIGLDMGFVVLLHSQLRLGFTTKNVNRPKTGKSKENRPQTYQSGLSVQVQPNVTINLDIFKEVRFPAEVRFGVEIKPYDILALRAGTASNPNRFSAGFGIKVNRFTIDYAFFSHNDLGFTHQASLSFDFGRNAKEKKPGSQQIATAPKPTKESARPIQDRKININEASLKELITLPGVGKALAQTIIDYRIQHGPFKQIEDLLHVPGIGEKKLQKLKKNIFIDQVAEK
ncbi:MAG: helix-hairpin-helix domain-containing protein [bacterium]